jgi:prepilin-type N-terminal cleavage/methylation domain-containing protein
MTNNSINKSPRQNGFTIVELLVALALVLFIMSIISQVFVDASEAFRSARSKAELTEKLRFITQTLRADLRSRHFENGRKLSDSDFWKVGPPKAGYFRIEHKTNLPEYAPDGVTQISNSLGEPLISGNPTAGHVIAFTGFQNGQNANDFYSVQSPTNPSFLAWKNGGGLYPQDSRFEDNSTFNSPDAEIAWFLGPDAPGFSKEFPMQDELGAPATIKVFSLYRRLWLLAPNNPAAPMPIVTPTENISVNPTPPLSDINFGQWNTEFPNSDVPIRRGLGFGFTPNAVSNWKNPNFNPLNVATAPYLIADNILSFTVEVLPENDTKFLTLQNAFGSRVFDTWSSRPYGGNDFSKWNVPGDLASIPMIPSTAPMGTLPPRIIAIRVTIRLYDTNNALSPSKTTWQATLVEPL